MAYTKGNVLGATSTLYVTFISAGKEEALLHAPSFTEQWLNIKNCTLNLGNEAPEI